MLTTPTFDVHLGSGDIAGALAADVRQGLTATPKTLPPKWFYDARGSKLFERITDIDEYYLTGCEFDVLERFSPEQCVH